MSTRRWQAGLWAFVVISLLGSLAAPSCAASVSRQGVVQRGDYLARPDVQEFLDSMVEEHDFDHDQLEKLFAQVHRQDRVLEAIARPAEAKPWKDYRPIFLTDARIEGGVDFWHANEELLARAESEMGVAPEYVVAIIGVETFYGQRTGSFRVLDTLTTLGFDYPPRADFFRRELEQYLLLTREETLDPLELTGSYAGAMGKGQFISSSYRMYAVDFDGDGRRDLWGSVADAVGSVANYFRRHGWEHGAPVTVPAAVTGSEDAHELLVSAGVKPTLSLPELAAAGIRPAEALGDDSESVSVIELDGANGVEYWIGFDNFYVITRYNRSPLYAMAVHQLAQEIRRLHDERWRTATR